MFREPLPSDCPPEDAEEITCERIVFRLVDDDPAVSEDFDSFFKLTGKTRGQECIAKSVSVFESAADAAAQTHLPKLKNKLVCQVTLGAGAGRIKQTFNPSHHSWWPYDAFDICSVCEVQGT